MKRLSLPLIVTAALTAAATPAAAAAPSAAPTLSHYLQRRTPVTTAPAGTQRLVDANCPRGTRVVGGGAVLSGAGLAQSLNTSAPVYDGQRWRVRVNNAGTADSSFRAYAVCAAGITDYSVVEGVGVDNPPGTQTTRDVSCPTGTVPLGGGAAPTSPSTSVALNSSEPTATGWRVRVNNASTGDDDFVIPYVVCGTRPAGYRQLTGPSVAVKAASQGQALASCPAGTRVLDGGVRSGSKSTRFSVDSSLPTSGRDWQVFADNASASASTITPYAICAAFTG